jgi:hypothetical protein
MRPALALVLVLGAMPLAAHHSPAAVYDINRIVRMQGTVTEVRWTNPHATFLLDVQSANGSIVHWTVELPAPSSLIGQGYTRHDIMPGDRITADVWIAKNGSPNADARTVTLAGGKTMSGVSRWDPPYTFATNR